MLIITVAAYLGVPMASMITVLGSAGVAIGLALQGGLSNIAGGLMILVFRPFSVGDYIDCGQSSNAIPNRTNAAAKPNPKRRKDCSLRLILFCIS